MPRWFDKTITINCWSLCRIRCHGRLKTSDLSIQIADICKCLIISRNVRKFLVFLLQAKIHVHFKFRIGWIFRTEMPFSSRKGIENTCIVRIVSFCRWPFPPPTFTGKLITLIRFLTCRLHWCPTMHNNYVYYEFGFSSRDLGVAYFFLIELANVPFYRRNVQPIVGVTEKAGVGTIQDERMNYNYPSRKRFPNNARPIQKFCVWALQRNG